MKTIKLTVFFILFLIIFHVKASFGWHDETHLAAAKAAGYYKWYNTTGADITKIKAGSIERYNHFFNNTFNIEVTPTMVFNQVMRYNNPNNTEGHLYGAIMASLREYQSMLKTGKYSEYNVAFFAHYLTDLSQPLHNVPYDDFNKSHHIENDGIVEKEVLQNIKKIKTHMYPIHLRPDYFEQDLAKEIARIANLARQLAFKLKKENRNMSKEEAYIQLGHSASLLKAVLKYLEKIKK
jgi:hypothetical protein